MRRLCLMMTMVAFVVGCVDHRRGDAKAALARWNAFLARELPRGTPRNSVESFFKRHGLESRFSSADQAMVAIDSDVETGGAVSTSITFKCAFDSAQKLQSCAATEAYTGP